jgi:hypothetical protein
MQMIIVENAGFYLPGPLRTLAGSVMIVLNRSNTALTVIPTRRNGRRRSQIIGYKMSPKIARGQQNTSKISQSRNLINMVSSFEPPQDSRHAHVMNSH